MLKEILVSGGIEFKFKNFDCKICVLSYFVYVGVEWVDERGKNEWKVGCSFFDFFYRCLFVFF